MTPTQYFTDFFNHSSSSSDTTATKRRNVASDLSTSAPTLLHTFHASSKPFDRRCKFNGLSLTVSSPPSFTQRPFLKPSISKARLLTSLFRIESTQSRTTMPNNSAYADSPSLLSTLETSFRTRLHSFPFSSIFDFSSLAHARISSAVGTLVGSISPDQSDSSRTTNSPLYTPSSVVIRQLVLPSLSLRTRTFSITFTKSHSLIASTFSITTCATVARAPTARDHHSAILDCATHKFA